MGMGKVEVDTLSMEMEKCLLKKKNPNMWTFHKMKCVVMLWLGKEN